MITRRTLLKSLILPYFGHDFIVSAHEKNINININDSVSPEMFGAVGDGIKDDSLAMKMCFDSKKKVIFKKNAKYLWTKKIVVTGAINVDAQNATILCDEVFLEVIDGAGSSWLGGVMNTITQPYIVSYNNNWSVSKLSSPGSGRMPFYDEPNINNEIKNQRIGCCLLFRSSSELIQIGLNVKNLTANNGALIIAGFSEVTVDNCKVKGGSHIACIAIINGSKEPLLWGYSTNDISDYEYGRGRKIIIKNCYLYECANNGLYITGTDDVHVDNCKFIDNGESGIKTGQYVQRWWTTPNRCCSSVDITNCYAAGQYYDGFDLQNAFGSGKKLYKDSFVTSENNISIHNRRAGFISQGGGNKFFNCHAEGNGIHGIMSNQSRSVEMYSCKAINNCIGFDGVELGLCGPDSIMKNCVAINSLSKHNVLLINHTIGTQWPNKFYGVSDGNSFNDLKRCIIDPRIAIVGE